MKLGLDQADVLEELLLSDEWKMILEVFNERIADRQRQLVSGRATDYTHYRALVESIREAEYLRDRPMQLVREARMGAK